MKLIHNAAVTADKLFSAFCPLSGNFARRPAAGDVKLLEDGAHRHFQRGGGA